VLKGSSCTKAARRSSATSSPPAEGLERIRKARTTHGLRAAEMDRMRAMAALNDTDQVLHGRCYALYFNCPNPPFLAAA
jgi:hypothetical protein